MTLTAAQKSQISRAFTLVARQFDLPNVDAQRMGMAFMAALDSLEPGQPVGLQGLFDYLVKEQRISHLDVLDFCIVLQSRHDKIGVVFEMPAQAREVTPERVERVLHQFNKKTNPAAFERRNTDPAAEAAPAPGAAWEPSKQKKGGPNKGLMKALAVLAVVGIGFQGYRLSLRDELLKEVPLEQTFGGPGCVRIVANAETAICDLPVNLWNPSRVTSVREQANRLRQSLSGKGVQRVMVRLWGQGNPNHGSVVVTVP